MIPAGRNLATLVAVLSLELFAPPSFAAPERSEFELDRVVPGATSADLQEAFGEPRSTERSATADVRREDFALPRAGYAQVSAWFDPDGAMTCARVIPVRALKPAAAELLFDLRSGATRSEGHAFTGAEVGHFLQHRREGVHFFLEEGRVLEIWRTAPNTSPTELRGDLGADYPARPLPDPPDPPDTSEANPLDPETVPAPPVVAGEALPDGAPPRLLSMEAPHVSIVLDDEFRPQLAITAVVFANGLRAEEIRFEGLLRPFPPPPEGGRPLTAIAAAPAELRDRNGFLHPHFTERVVYDSSRFDTPTLLFPLHLLQDYDTNYSGHLQVSFEATGGGLASFGAVVASVPGPRLPEIGPVPIIDAGPVRTEPGELEGLGAGLWIHRDITLTNGRGRILGTYLFLRRTDGRHVGAAANWDSWRLDDGRFYSLAQDEALHDVSSWTPFRTFLPFAALDLEPGPHHLILRTQSSIGTLGGAVERELTITIPGEASGAGQVPGGRR
jgi:hypothetical protein